MSISRWAAPSFGDGTHVIDELPLSDMHPLRHGRLRITLEVKDGRVTRCSFDPSSNHRGDEKLLEVRDYRQGMALINRHGWLTSPFAETLYARIIETMLGITISSRASALRDLALALNAAAVEAYWDAAMSDGDALRTREDLLGHLERLTGARMHVTYARVGGVAADIYEDQLRELGDHPIPAIADVSRRVRDGDGPLQVTLPKVVRLPEGDCYQEMETPHGRLGIWVVSRGDRVPHRVHLRTTAFAALARLERDAVGMTAQDVLTALINLRMVPGEVAR